MKWINESKNNAGFSVYYAIPDRDPNVLYVIQRKRATPEFKPTIWRTFARTSKTEPLKTIFTDEKKGVCEEFVEELEKALAAGM
jgi:hypothetical protein